MSQRSKKRRPKGVPDPAGPKTSTAAPVAGICALLVILIFAVFGQTVHHGFINFDDNVYIYENPVLSRGLSLAGLGWAFTHTLSANWHPLTTIVHMLDSQVYGLWAGGHHLTNVLLHAACAVLLFLTLIELTGALWCSAFVAALFAVHPLRVESVAWVSELKDVLSGLFFMLTLRAYARYARRPESRGRYAMVMVWLALGLMSKPMLVTVPCVLLLLDYWPLGRLQSRTHLRGLLREKLPFFALAALSSVATILAQKQAIQPIWELPLHLRIGNALVAYVIYLGKLIWPVHLAAIYPLLKNGPPAWQVIAASLLLASLTTATYLLRWKQPYLLVGWLWYIGMLLPVIGILQVGQQAYADRYTYLPTIGLCLAGTWTAAQWAGARQDRRALVGTLALLILCAMPLAAWRQTTYWHDSETLWTHALVCTTDNYVAHVNLGIVLDQEGRTDDAIAQYRDALQIIPFPEAYYDLGNSLMHQGRTADAIAGYRDALKLNPSYALAHDNLGTALLRQGRVDEAVDQYRAAVQSDPAFAEAYYNLGVALIQQGRIEDAITQYREAVRLYPAYTAAYTNLGNALFQQGRTSDAIAQYREALKISPDDLNANYNIGNALYQHGEDEEAISHAGTALQLQPNNPVIQNSLAWMLATAPHASLRNGTRAVQLAAQATESTGATDPNFLRTLAAAYAQAGDFPDAVKTAQKGLQLNATRSNAALSEKLRREITLYQARQPYENAQ